jgi:hypothetical protein
VRSPNQEQRRKDRQTAETPRTAKADALGIGTHIEGAARHHGRNGDPAHRCGSRGIFQRTLYRERYFGGDAKGQIIFVLRCIFESNGNENASIGPIVYAVSSCLTPELTNRGLDGVIEAFDKISLVGLLERMRSLDLFREDHLGSYLATSLRNKLHRILGPAKKPEPAVKSKPKRPFAKPARLAA